MLLHIDRRARVLPVVGRRRANWAAPSRGPGWCVAGARAERTWAALRWSGPLRSLAGHAVEIDFSFSSELVKAYSN